MAQLYQKLLTIKFENFNVFLLKRSVLKVARRQRRLTQKKISKPSAKISAFSGIKKVKLPAYSSDFRIKN